MLDRPGDGEVERCAATLGDDGSEKIAERLAAEEEGERLVLVRRPGPQEPAEDDCSACRDGRGASPENVGLVCSAVYADDSASVFDSRAHL